MRSTTFTTTPWIELPQSVQTIEARTLADWGATTPSDAWRMTSGVFATDQDLQSRYGGLPSMRGLRGSQTTLNGFTMPQRMATWFDLGSIASIDMAKGPTDALDGAQTPSLTMGGFGGQVNLVSHAPDDDPSLATSLSARGFGDRRLRLSVEGNRPVGESLQGRIDASAQLGQRFFVPRGYPSEWSFALAPVVRLEVGPKVELTLRGAWTQQKGYAYKGVPVLYGQLLGDYDAFLGTEDDTYQYASGMLQLEADAPLSESISVKAAVSWMHLDLDYSMWSWGASRTFSFDDMFETGTGLPSFVEARMTGEALGTRVFGVGDFTTGFWKHQALLGADVERLASTSESSPWTVPATPTPISSPTLPAPRPADENTITGPLVGGKSQSDTVRYGTFAQYQARVTRFVRLLAGARLDHHRFEDQLARVTHEKTEPSWRAGLTLLPFERLAVYGSFTSSSSPNFGLLDGQGEPITESQGLRQAEVGVKAKVLGRLQASAAGFRIWTDHVPVALPAQPGATVLQYELTGEGTYQGVELAVQGRAFSFLEVLGSYTWLDIETPEVGAMHNLAPHSVSAWAVAQLPGRLSGLRLGTGYRYVARREVGYGPTGDGHTLPSHHLFDVLGEYAVDDWVARLNVSNLFDRRYYTSARQASEIGAGEPRSVMLTLSTRY